MNRCFASVVVAATMLAFAGEARGQAPFDTYTVVKVLGNFGTANLDHLIQASDGNFYGTISNGHAFNVYKMTPAGVVTVVHSFISAGSTVVGALLQATDGNFYGAYGVSFLTQAQSSR